MRAFGCCEPNNIPVNAILRGIDPSNRVSERAGRERVGVVWVRVGEAASRERRYVHKAADKTCSSQVEAWARCMNEPESEPQSQPQLELEPEPEAEAGADPDVEGESKSESESN